MNILTVITTVASVISVLLSVQKVTNNPIIWIIAAILAEFGGDFLICCLPAFNEMSAIFSSPEESMIKLALAISITIIFFKNAKHHPKDSSPLLRFTIPLHYALLVADSLDVLSAAAYGYEQGIKMEAPFQIIILYGWLASIAGKILAMLFISTQVGQTFICKTHWIKIEFKKSVSCYICSFIIVFTYVVMIQIIGEENSFLILIPLSVYMGVSTDQNTED